MITKGEMALDNNTGKVFGYRTIIDFSHKDKKGSKFYNTYCRCGKYQQGVSLYGLKKSISCGCILKEKRIKKAKEIVGETFGMLTVLELSSEKTKSGNFLYICKCDCGKVLTIPKSNLYRSENPSCGCYGHKLASERMSKYQNRGNKKMYNVWFSMKDRCNNTKNKNYKNYGERGIKVCDRWLESFDNFYEDMGERPSSKHQLDRIDNNGNYEPSNCRWTLPQSNVINRRKNKDYAISKTGKDIYQVRLSRDYSYKRVSGIQSLEKAREIRDFMVYLYENEKNIWNNFSTTIPLEYIEELKKE